MEQEENVSQADSQAQPQEVSIVRSRPIPQCIIMMHYFGIPRLFQAMNFGLCLGRVGNAGFKFYGRNLINLPYSLVTCKCFEINYTLHFPTCDSCIADKDLVNGNH